jgi:hypothetical protein
MVSLVLRFLLLVAQVPGESVHFLTGYSEALTKASSSKRLLFADFYTDH